MNQFPNNIFQNLEHLLKWVGGICLSNSALEWARILPESLPGWEGGEVGRGRRGEKWVGEGGGWGE